MRFSKVALTGLLLAPMVAGCILAPTDDGRVASTTAPLPFSGFHLEPDRPVQVRAWSFAGGAWEDVGAPVRSSTTPSPGADQPLYDWAATRTLEPRFWQPGPAGGSCANVGATSILANGSTVNMQTVERDWLQCFSGPAHQTVGGFQQHCTSDHNPAAQIYTGDWAPITVTQTALNQAGQLASQLVHITLDDYQPIAYAFCNSSKPSGCPPGLSSDPETYKFYNPNASSIRYPGDTLAFGITPSRSDPMTVYIDDMSSAQLYFRVDGSKFVLGIKFEGNGTEIRMNCIRNALCAVLGDPVIDFPSPSAELSFVLAAHDGGIDYTDVSTVFTTGLSGNPDADRAAAAIAAAMTDKLMNDPDIHAAVGGALDQIIQRAAGLAPFPLAGVSINDGVLQVKAGCPVPAH